MSEETLSFETEVGRILQIVANSLYSNKEIFLRELISNASDACDRLRYASITDQELLSEGSDYKVTITAHQEDQALSIEDNGIGMNREALIADLGTIARSGSSSFLEQLSGDQKKDVALIGQFGVGFYSVFMVSEKVEVVSRRAGESSGWLWKSDGAGEFTISETEKDTRGTKITLFLKEDAREFLEQSRLRQIVTTYSDHISLPIELDSGQEVEVINKGSALWSRPRNEITNDQYTEFYRHISHAFDEPWMTLHWRAEGVMEYTGLIFIPNSRPFDLFTAERTHRVKLYVKRVYITDKCEELVPGWLRFLRGLIDSEDIPLNVSRELLQTNPLVSRIRKALVSRVLAELEKNDFWLPAVGDWNGKNFKSATRGGTDFSDIKEKDSDTSSNSDAENISDEPSAEIASLISMIKLELGDAVKDVRISSRLTESPVCLIADEGDIDINLERILRQHQQIQDQVTRVLEINPKHPVITSLSGAIGDKGTGNLVSEAAWILLDQARILEGEPLPDPTAFSRRISLLMERCLASQGQLKNQTHA